MATGLSTFPFSCRWMPRIVDGVEVIASDNLHNRSTPFTMPEGDYVIGIDLQGTICSFREGGARSIGENASVAWNLEDTYGQTLDSGTWVRGDSVALTAYPSQTYTMVIKAGSTCGRALGVRRTGQILLT